MLANVDQYDICIVGASLAGNYLCYLLSRADLKIIVIEEHHDIGHPFQCAGIISKKITQIIEVPNTIILNRIKIAKIVAPSGKAIRLSGDEQPCVVDRVALDQLFYEKVKNNDKIRFYLGEKFISFTEMVENGQRFVLIKTSKRKIKSKMIIGCDGPVSTVARHFGIKNKVLYAAQIRVKNDFNPNEVVMFFDPRWKELFGWIVPEGKNNIYRIGIASATNIHQKFKYFLKNIKIDINKKIDQQGGMIPYGIMNQCGFDNCLLIGDAACQVKATTGGGIIMLLTATKIAARTIIKNFQTNDFSAQFIKKNYEKQCFVKIGKQLKLHYMIRMVFEKFSSKDYELFFRIIKTSEIEKIISFYGDMDFPKTMVLRLLRNFLIINFLVQFVKKNPLLVLELLKIMIKRY